MYQTGGSQRERGGTVRELDERIAAYFESCDRADPPRFPTEPGLMLFLGLSESDWRGMVGAKEGYRKYAPCVRRALLEIRDRLEQRKDSFAVFLLKQKRYGGYADKPEADGSGPLQIQVTFVKPRQQAKGSAPGPGRHPEE